VPLSNSIAGFAIGQELNPNLRRFQDIRGLKTHLETRCLNYANFPPPRAENLSRTFMTEDFSHVYVFQTLGRELSYIQQYGKQNLRNVSPEHLVRADVQKSGDVVDDVFDGDQSLRSSEASERRVRRQVSLTHVTSRAETRNVVTVVTAAQRPSHHLHTTTTIYT